MKKTKIEEMSLERLTKKEKTMNVLSKAAYAMVMLSFLIVIVLVFCKFDDMNVRTMWLGITVGIEWIFVFVCIKTSNVKRMISKEKIKKFKKFKKTNS